MDREFIRYSAEIGENPLLVQGAGGNTSLKDGKTLWVKASGKWMIHAEQDSQFVAVDLDLCSMLIAAGDADPVSPAIFPGQPLRPSIETTLHALLPHRVVVHTHPVVVLAEAVRQDACVRLSDRLSGLNWCWVDYARPGIDLTRQVKRALAMVDGPVDILILGNHGLVVGGDNCAIIDERMTQILESFDTRPTEVEARSSQALTGLAVEHGMYLPEHAMIHALATDSHCYAFCKNAPLYPDQAVFLGPFLSLVSEGQSADSVIQKHIESMGRPPAVLILEGLGVLIESEHAAAVEAMLLGHLELLRRLSADAPLRTLSDIELGALLDWEPERYRQSLAKMAPDTPSLGETS